MAAERAAAAEDDQASDPSRQGVFRLNVGVGRQTSGTLFSAPPAGGEGAYDFMSRDHILSHPVDGIMYWVCVLNPNARTFETARGLLAEACEAGMRQGAKRAERPNSSDSV